MAAAAGESDGRATVLSPRAVTLSWFLIGGFVAVLALGYAMRWRWTGFDQDRRLWDLLHLIVLPAVLVTLPLWYRTRANWQRAWHAAFGTVAALFAAMVVGGYAFGWAWTGFQGNTLWDWLELLALPVVVALLPLWLETHRRLEAEWRIGLTLLAAGFTVTVVGGYALGWTWTGFHGNTLLQWVRLLFVPFVLPASIAWYSTQIRFREEEPAAPPATSAAPASSSDPPSALPGPAPDGTAADAPVPVPAPDGGGGEAAGAATGLPPSSAPV
ncbi:MAG: hypothetical protein ACRDYZ_00420 [Acidimicrobiales bacterium]